MNTFVSVFSAIVSVSSAVIAYSQAHTVVKHNARVKFLENKMEKLLTIFKGKGTITYVKGMNPDETFLSARSSQELEQQHEGIYKTVVEKSAKYLELRHLLKAARRERIETNYKKFIEDFNSSREIVKKIYLAQVFLYTLYDEFHDELVEVSDSLESTEPKPLTFRTIKDRIQFFFTG